MEKNVPAPPQMQWCSTEIAKELERFKAKPVEVIELV